jgi:hypothetical protein
MLRNETAVTGPLLSNNTDLYQTRKQCEQERREIKQQTTNCTKTQPTKYFSLSDKVKNKKSRSHPKHI